jgi:hypothetical protein
MPSNTLDPLAGNRLLALLPVEKLENLRRNCQVASLRREFCAITPDEPIRNVYFPINCLLSMVTTMEDDTAVESGSLGREGCRASPSSSTPGRRRCPSSAR